MAYDKHDALKPAQTASVAEAVLDLTNPDSGGLFFENPDTVVASSLLPHHGVLGWQLGMLANFSSCTVTALCTCRRQMSIVETPKKAVFTRNPAK